MQARYAVFCMALAVPAAPGETSGDTITVDRLSSPILPPCLPQVVDTCGTGGCTALQCWSVLVSYRAPTEPAVPGNPPPSEIMGEALCGQTGSREVAECRATKIMQYGLWFDADPVTGSRRFIPPTKLEPGLVVNTR